MLGKPLTFSPAGLLRIAFIALAGARCQPGGVYRLVGAYWSPGPVPVPARPALVTTWREVVEGCVTSSNALSGLESIFLLLKTRKTYQKHSDFYQKLSDS